MIVLLALLMLSAPAAEATSPSPHPDPSRQVITRCDIETAGLYRLSDLLRLIEGARTTTVDGLTWRVSLLDPAPFDNEQWVLLLDGDRLDLQVLGQQNLSLAPVAITQIDSVEVWPAPRMAAGTLAAAGTIHIHTAQRHEGRGARLGGAIGLQNGDPGPFRYVPELSTLNVDKFGGDYEAWLGAAGTGWRTSARFQAVRFYPTHRAAIERNQEMLNGADIPRARLLSGALRMERELLGGRHSAQLMGSTLADMWFYEPFGRELSTRRTFGQAAVRGTFGAAGASQPRPEITYRLSASQNHLDKRFDRSLGPDPGWRGRTLAAGIDASVPVRNLSLTAAGALERRQLDGAQGVTLGRFSFAVSRVRTEGQERVETMLAYAERDVAAGIALTSANAVGAGTLRFSASAVQRLPVEVGGLSFWAARGYRAFDSEIDIEAVAPGVATIGQLRMDAAFPMLSTGLQVSGGLGVSASRGLPLEHASRAPDPDDLVAEREMFAAPAEGAVIHGRAAVTGRQGVWDGRLWLDTQVPLAGDDDWERAWRRVPGVRAGFRGAVRPHPGFAASAAFSYQSAAAWPSYAHLSGGNDGLYQAAVPATWLLDAALEKWLWHRRVRGSLLFMNLLAQEERYHPVGATLNRRFYLRVELRLG